LIYYGRTAACLGTAIIASGITANLIIMLVAEISGGLLCPDLAKIGIEKYYNEELESRRYSQWLFRFMNSIVHKFWYIIIINNNKYYIILY